MYLIPLPRTGWIIFDRPEYCHCVDVALDDNDLETAKLLQQEIKKVIAITLPIKKGLRGAGNLAENCIYFQYDNMDRSNEAYRLTVGPNKITIAAC